MYLNPPHICYIDMLRKQIDHICIYIALSLSHLVHARGVAYFIYIGCWHQEWLEGKQLTKKLLRECKYNNPINIIGTMTYAWP